MKANNPPIGATADFDAAVAAQASARYVLRLYITGTTPHSSRAIVNIRKICEEHLPLPLRRFIGDMSQTERILLGLDLRETKCG